MYQKIWWLHGRHATRSLQAIKVPSVFTELDKGLRHHGICLYWGSSLLRAVQTSHFYPSTTQTAMQSHTNRGQAFCNLRSSAPEFREGYMFSTDMP